MNFFKIIPVIDILNSTAVHAKKGERAKYRPIESKFFQSSNPVEIIKNIINIFNLNEFYIADLDSIINKNPNFQLLKEILNISNIEVILDAGINDPQDIFIFKEYKIKSLILGLETINSFEVIERSTEFLNKNKIIVSIDMFNGEILSTAKEIKNQDLLTIIKRIESLGIKTIILLDLFRVGQKVGGIPPIYLDIVKKFDGDVYVGGGIKNNEDILDYKEKNFSGVLIATALYDGTINVERLLNLD